MQLTMRRLSVKKRGRSASIAECGAAEEDPEQDPGSRPLLTRTRSARRYQPSAWTAADLQDLSAASWQSYYLRCFSLTSKGVVSRGDYVRYRRVGDRGPVREEGPEAIEEFTVYLVGAAGVGKTALTQQFTTSEHILNANTKDPSSEGTMVTISLDGEESRLVFKEVSSVSALEPVPEEAGPCAFLVVYSVTQAESFAAATCILCQLLRSKYEAVLILVGNKSDLVRSRSVDSEEGLSLATNYKVKFIETSVGINYNVDELLVGVLTHLRALLKNHGEASRQLSRRDRFSGARSSIRRMIRRVLKKDEPQTTNCDIFKKA